MFGEIRNKNGEKLDYTFHCGNPESKHIVVLGHGVTGNKDRPFLVALAQALEAKGINVLRFSFAGNGNSEGRFEDATITKEVDDLGSVLDTLKRLYNLLCRAQHGRRRRRIAGEHGCAHSTTHLSRWHGRYQGICTARIWRGHPRRRQHVG